MAPVLVQIDCPPDSTPGITDDDDALCHHLVVPYLYVYQGGNTTCPDGWDKVEDTAIWCMQGLNGTGKIPIRVNEPFLVRRHAYRVGSFLCSSNIFIYGHA